MNKFEQNINELLANIDKVVSDALLILAGDAKAIIQNRVQQQGKTASGNSTGQYTQKYKKHRENEGYQTSYMDLTYSGEMWRSIGVTETVVAKQSKVTVAGRDTLTQLLIDVHSEKRFEVLKLSKEEEVVIDEIFDEIMTEKITDYLSQ